MKNITNIIKSRLKQTPIIKLREVWLQHIQRPKITQAWMPPINERLEKTLLICVESNFNQKINNANYLTPLSFAQGWTEVAGGAKFIFVKDLLREIEKYDNPAVFISQQHFRHFTFKEARKLREKNLFVWVHVHPRAFGRFEQENPLVPTAESDTYLDAYAKLICSEPKFVWNAVAY